MASLWSSAWVCPPLATPQPVSAAGDLFVLPPPGRAGVVPAASPAMGCCKGQVLQLVAASHVAASAKAEPATNPLLAAATAGGTRLEGSRALGMGRVLVWDVGAFQDETSMTFSHPNCHGKGWSCHRAPSGVHAPHREPGGCKPRCVLLILCQHPSPCTTPGSRAASRDRGFLGLPHGLVSLAEFPHIPSCFVTGDSRS